MVNTDNKLVVKKKVVSKLKFWLGILFCIILIVVGLLLNSLNHNNSDNRLKTFKDSKAEPVISSKSSSPSNIQKNAIGNQYINNDPVVDMLSSLSNLFIYGGIAMFIIPLIVKILRK